MSTEIILLLCIICQSNESLVVLRGRFVPVFVRGLCGRNVNQRDVVDLAERGDRPMKTEDWQECQGVGESEPADHFK